MSRFIKGVSYEAYETMVDALGGCGWVKAVYEAAGDVLDIEVERCVKLEIQWDILNVSYIDRNCALCAEEYQEIIIM